MSQRLIKVFGERNTATRAVLRMIDAAPMLLEAGHPGVEDEDLQKYDIMIDQISSIYAGPWRRVYREAIKDLRARELGALGAWKHAAPAYDPIFKALDVSTLFMVRNPYSWALSLHRRPYHCMGRRQQSLEDFLVFPWLCLGRDNVEPILSSPVYLWNLKLASYAKFRTEAHIDGVGCATLRFEQFVQDPVTALSRVLDKLDLPSGSLTAFFETTKVAGDFSKDRRSYYMNERWREDLTATSVGLINDMIDWDLAEVHGYTRLDPQDFPEETATAAVLSDRKRRAAAAA